MPNTSPSCRTRRPGSPGSSLSTAFSELWREEPVTTATDFRLCRERSRAKKLPHLPEGRVRLLNFRILQVDLNIIERGIANSDLGHLIPAIVFLSPAIQVSQPDIAMAHTCCADLCFRAQHDGGHVFLVPWNSWIDFLNGQIPCPYTHIEKTIICHTSPKILNLRVNGEHIPRTHR